MTANRRGVMRRLRHSDEGMALVFVVGSMLLLATLLTVGLAYTMSSTKFSRYDQDYTAAMTAAQSGVEDFIARLNRDDDYGRTVDCSNDAMVTPTGCGLDYGWSPVEPSETDPAAAHYHYQVDTTSAWVNGTIMVVSTGRVNGVYRTIEVAVGKGGSTDYVYYTDFEDADPDNKSAYPSGASRECGGQGASLADYYYEGRSCVEIQFGSNDVLDGKVFSNDAILSRGGRFLQSVESAYPACNNVVASNRSTWDRCLRSGSYFTATGTSATFQVAPAYHENFYLADSSAEFAAHPGCHYYGATRIVFHDNGTMTVWSKSSNFTSAVLAIAPPGGTAPECGAKSDLASTYGATVPVPDGMVIYADGAPTSGDGAVVRRQLYQGEIGGETGRTLPLGTWDGSAPSNQYDTYTVDKSMQDARKYTGEGNVYVEGVVKGRVTVAAAQSVVVTGDLVLAGGSSGADLVGLVATNSVEVMHPWIVTYGAYRSGGRYYWNASPNSGGTDVTSPSWPHRIADPARGGYYPTQGVQVAASIQTLQHSFTVQQYNLGHEQHTLFVMGSIAQRFRGAVGTTAPTGYDKDYRYDVRLKYTAPPYWPHWVNAQWSLRYSGEVRSSDQPWVP